MGKAVLPLLGTGPLHVGGVGVRRGGKEVAEIDLGCMQSTRRSGSERTEGKWSSRERFPGSTALAGLTYLAVVRWSP